jgi:hypothetical protein
MATTVAPAVPRPVQTLFAPKALHFLVFDCRADARALRYAIRDAVPDCRSWTDVTQAGEPPGSDQKPLGRDDLTPRSSIRFSHAAAETAIELRLQTDFQRPAKSEDCRRGKVCRTQDEQPISGGEYWPSRYEQLGRQRLYLSVTI